MFRDQCAYKKEGNTEDTYCFKTEGATHNTVCQEIGQDLAIYLSTSVPTFSYHLKEVVVLTRNTTQPPTHPPTHYNWHTKGIRAV